MDSGLRGGGGGALAQTLSMAATVERLLVSPKLSLHTGQVAHQVSTYLYFQ